MKKIAMIFLGCLSVSIAAGQESSLVKEHPKHYLASLYNPWVSQCIDIAVRLNIPELLQEGPKTIGQLAQLTGVNENSLNRVMRLLVDIEIFEESEDGVFQHNRVSEFLLKSHPQSLAPYSLFFDSYFYQVWPNLLASIKTGESAFDLTYKGVPYETMQKTPELLQKVNNYILTRSLQAIETILKVYDFSPYPTIIDVGGNTGLFLQHIKSRYPDMQGIVFDLPETIATSMPVKDIKYEGGSFFDGVPKGGDLYILQSILHDWSDEQAIAILKKCKEAMPKEAKLIIIELCIEEHSQRKNTVKIEDVKLNALTGGFERTYNEYCSLIQAAGFHLSQALDTTSGYKIIEIVSHY